MKKNFIFFLLLVTSSTYALVLNLKDADIHALINTVSQATGKNFIIDPRVKGKINVVNYKDIEDDRLYQFFSSILQVHGYVIIPGDDFDKILPKNTIKNTSPTIGSDDLIVSAVLAVNNVSAKELVPILRPLVSQYGYLAAYQASNSIIMTDTGASIKRIKDLIDALDKQVDDDYEIIVLKHTSAQEVANIIKALLANKKTSNGLVISVNTQANQIIIGGNKNKRLKARFLISELDQGESGGTSVVYLKHANAKNILPILQGIANSDKKIKTADNTTQIQADEATNAIIITAPSALSLNLKKIINKLDIERAQVLIEVVVAEISSSNAEELGIGLLGLNASKGAGVTNFNQQVSALLGSLATGAPALKAGANYIIGDFNKDSSGKYTSGLGLIVSALNSIGNADILSTPSIVTLDNEEAEIIVGNEVPFITNTQLSNDNSNPFQNFERKNVGLTLKVKPQINEGNGIKLVIEQEVSNILPSSNAVDIITSKRKIKTTVMVGNNKLLVLGGMIDNIINQTQQKVPLLGDIPILGRLFRYDRESKEKRHLLLFIRPTILTKDNVDDISNQKYNYIKAKNLLGNTEQILPDYSKIKTQPKITPVKVQPIKVKASDFDQDASDPYGDDE
ncbi:General secretion pathway protein D [uncultured Candidatus Thioglobus sp.]|nr:General secretion pathway protein D [uncultured Candidatus Thioglobus sp.]